MGAEGGRPRQILDCDCAGAGRLGRQAGVDCCTGCSAGARHASLLSIQWNYYGLKRLPSFTPFITRDMLSILYLAVPMQQHPLPLSPVR